MTEDPRQLRLGVNVDHVATLRNARGGPHPCPIRAAHAAAAAGAGNITAHLREDRRHIRDADLRRLKREIEAPLNMEMAATPEMRDIAVELRPPACCLVPERREEVTTEGGLDVAGSRSSLAAFLAPLQAAGIQVSLFIDPEADHVAAAADLGADAVELHTGGYAEAADAARRDELARLTAAAVQAHAAGLEVHAGHGMTYDNVPAIAAIPEIVELNIGHFLVSQAVFDGLETAVAEMRRIMRRSRIGDQ